MIVVDIFPHWSGPCELMNPTYKYLSQNIDDFDKRIEFGQLEFEKLKLLKDDKKFQTICMPKFLFILKGKIEDEVNGANIPDFTEKVKRHIPLSL